MTIPLDPRFIPAFSIEDVLLDKDTGAPLSGGLVYFERDNQRGLLKPVYQITGTSPNYVFTQLPNPMTLSAIGTFEDSLSNPTIPYFYPYDVDGEVELYYVRVTNSDDVPQFDRQAQPYISGNGSSTETAAFVNELSNPQFAIVDFTPASYTYNFNAASLEVVPIAPGWEIEVSCAGAGTVTVSQTTPLGTLNVPSNPGTLLNISSTGLTALVLRQRLYGSPNLWGSGYLACTYVAKTFGGTSIDMPLYYSQSDGTIVDQQINEDATLPASGAYTVFTGSANIPVSTSSEDYPDAYVDIFFNIPLSINVEITSVMVSFVGSVNVGDLIYEQTTLDRQIDQLFHYYKEPLDYKPIHSMLVGWDFPVNPAQFLGSSATITTTPAYIWDQTICESVVGNVAVVRNTVTSGFQATTANASEAFYQLQYLSGVEAMKVLGTPLSVNVNAYRTQAGGVCNVKVYLYVGTSSATIPTLPTSLGTMDAAGNFTLTGANWALVPRGTLGQASGSLSTVNTGDYSTLNDVVDLSFSGWEITNATQISNTNKFAIVVTYSCPTTSTVVTVNSVSLAPGSIPTRPAPMSYADTLHDCQRYYETSFLSGQVATATTTNIVAAPMVPYFDAGSMFCNANFFNYVYACIKRTAPTVTLYDGASVTPGQVTAQIATSPGGIVSTAFVYSMAWNPITSNTNGFNAKEPGVSTLVTAGSSSIGGANIQYHFVADARLGVV